MAAGGMQGRVDLTGLYASYKGKLEESWAALGEKVEP
jgi:hypothetical protein